MNSLAGQEKECRSERRFLAADSEAIPGFREQAKEQGVNFREKYRKSNTKRMMRISFDFPRIVPIETDLP